MWRDIALLNRDNLLATLDYFSRAIEEVKDAISARDGKKMEVLFQRSRDARRKI
jgi:prephenate dehydrogenase